MGQRRSFLKPKPAFTGEQLAAMNEKGINPFQPKKGQPKINATETAVNLAEERGVDLAMVTGTGVDGRITKGDVENYLQQQAQV